MATFWATFCLSKLINIFQGFKSGLMYVFWVFKLSFVLDILAFFDLATFWAIL